MSLIHEQKSAGALGDLSSLSTCARVVLRRFALKFPEEDGTYRRDLLSCPFERYAEDAVLEALYEAEERGLVERVRYSPSTHEVSFKLT